MPLANPYAKKRKDPSSDSGDRNGQHIDSTAPAHNSLAAGPSLHPRESTLSSRRFATFSQTFDYVADNNAAAGSDNREASSGSATATPARAIDAIDPSQPLPSATNDTTATNETFVNQHSHALYVSTRQKGNGVLNHIRNVPICFSKMSPDFTMSTSRCALFLSCKYHELHPDYIIGRMHQLDRAYALKVLLLLVDQEDCSETLLQLNCLAVEHNMTLILSWSEEEAARYLETFKAFDGHDASIIKKREETNFVDQVANVLAECKGINKTDSHQLLAQFGNFRSLVAASMDELGLVPGIGEVKVRRLYDALHKPFSSRKAAERKKLKQDEEVAKEERAIDETKEDHVGTEEYDVRKDS
ncbi:hypothetical protein MPSEU_000532400 [Mayamaea pseudoterrestris]|nr:hypothetical protein MPSEU_000532400 [Mayamaea pseudoterrestris]